MSVLFLITLPATRGMEPNEFAVSFELVGPAPGEIENIRAATRQGELTAEQVKELVEKKELIKYIRAALWKQAMRSHPHRPEGLNDDDVDDAFDEISSRRRSRTRGNE